MEFLGHTIRSLSCVVIFCGISLVGSDFQGPSSRAADVSQDEKVRIFEQDIRPILINHCYRCHGEDDDARGGEFWIDSPAGMLRGGTHGPSIVKGSPEKSLLVRAIEYHDASLQMPPDGRLPNEKIETLKQWIAQGAFDPRPEIPVGKSLESDGPSKQEKARKHWAYQPFHDKALSSVAIDPNALAKDIDQRIARKLSEQKLKPSPQTNRRTITRRLYLDLLGLSPTLEEIQAVQEDKRDDWYPQLVDRLLESPRFGERMARHWMDVMRYADNKGYVFKEDREYPYAYRYRDWLIRSFNEDLPYDKFVKYQLSGDKFDPDNAQGQLDAMGMLTLGRRFLQIKEDIVDDRIDVVSRGFLGVTAACARCHDHKFDPVSSADYYSMYAAFMGSDEPGGEPSPMRLIDKQDQSPTIVFLRGNIGNPGPTVDRKFFTGILADRSRPMTTGSGRFDMAQSIVEESQALTARVYTNRIWGWITSQSIVDTPSDFGLRCEPPVQRDVLEMLAASFVKSGWSTKHLIRSIVLTQTYRQQSLHRPDAYAIDPENLFLWRAQRRRMDFESFRDSMLLAARKMDFTIGGPSVKIHESPFSNRRTVYAYIDRQNLPSIFRSFDFASPDAHVPQRSQTTVPQQGLVLLNSDIMLDLLGSFRELDPSATDTIDLLFNRILARMPSSIEREWMAAFFRDAIVSLPSLPENSWKYGYGKISDDLKKIEAFHKLPLCKDKVWMGLRGTLPDEKLGWVSLTASGGHPGNGLGVCSIRRWTAPKDGRIHIHGKLHHSSDSGDGVRGHVFLKSKKLLGRWEAKHQEQETGIEAEVVKEGDTIDFVVDCKADENSDSYRWVTNIQYENSNDIFDSERNFTWELPLPLNKSQQAAQVLLLSNEFCFVD